MTSFSIKLIFAVDLLSIRGMIQPGPFTVRLGMVHIALQKRKRSVTSILRMNCGLRIVVMLCQMIKSCFTNYILKVIRLLSVLTLIFVI